MVRFGQPSKLMVGDYVLAIGAPYGLDQTATSGIVSAKGRSLPSENNENFVPFLQTDAAVNPGNSGGPLFDASGNVVGINSQIYSRTGGFQGVSFAIPIDVALAVKDQIVATGHAQHARLGVSIQPLTQDLAESFGLDRPDGALVSTIAPNSSAAKAGLKAGDVITKVNGDAIEEPGMLSSRIGLAQPGDKVTLNLWRDKKAETVVATLGAISDKTEIAKSDDATAGARAGPLAAAPESPGAGRGRRERPRRRRRRGRGGEGGCRAGRRRAGRQRQAGRVGRRRQEHPGQQAQARRAADLARRRADLLPGQPGLTRPGRAGARRLAKGARLRAPFFLFGHGNPPGAQAKKNRTDASRSGFFIPASCGAAQPETRELHRGSRSSVGGVCAFFLAACLALCLATAEAATPGDASPVWAAAAGAPWAETATAVARSREAISKFFMGYLVEKIGWGRVFNESGRGLVYARLKILAQY